MSITVKVEIYDGTPESAILVLDNLNIENDFYRYDVRSRKLTLMTDGLILNPGDHYQCRRINNETFKAI